MAVVFERLVHVRWRDTDALGHVNHAVFLTYLEEARDAFYTEALGSDPHYVVARLEVDLRAEVQHADQRVTVRWDPGQRRPIPFSETERARLAAAAAG